MKAELIEILETFEYPVRLQGSLAPDAEYPESFFTFWNDASTDGNHYDNKAVSVSWYFTVNFYTVDPDLVETVTESAIEKLKAAGWIVDGMGNDVDSGRITHTGRTFDATYMKY